MNLRNLSISARLGVAFGIVLAINACAMLYSVRTIGDMAGQFNVLTSETLAQVRNVEDWESLTQQNAPRSLAVAMTNDARLGELYSAQISATSKRIGEIQKTVESQISTPQARALFDKVSERRKVYLAERDKVFALKKKGEFEAAALMATGTMAQRLDAYRGATSELRDYERGRIDANAHAMAASADGVRKLLLGMLAGSLALTFIIAILLTRGITRPLAALLGIADRVAAGDLRGHIEPAGSDEIGALTQSVGTMQDNLKILIGRVRADVDAVTHSSGELAHAADELSASAESQTEAVASTAASVQELTASIVQVSENAEVARFVAEQTAEVSGLGVVQGGAAAREIGEIDRSIGEFGTQMAELTSRAGEIGSVVKLIKEIADQTNLLALNAAIEAARAGEQGRGFAVVADEVRKLAERTSAATTEIQNTIGAIQSSVGGASERIDGLKKRAAAGVACIERLMEPLNELGSGAARAVDNLRDLADATREQRVASEQIAGTTERVAAAAEQNRASVAQGRDTATELKSLAARLRASVGHFQFQ
ncbi:MAG TPA: methyl-accepting chemotaxis protein [Burkholderiales bacterium]|nr:methyl-accepting chemotaxis protein [Burkholderiales bacterium]